MGFFSRLSRLFRANLNFLVSKAEKPDLILDQAVVDMQADLVKLRAAVAAAMASNTRLKNQLQQAQEQSNTWSSRAELALRGNDEGLARQALERKRTYDGTVSALRPQVEAGTLQVSELKKSLSKLEQKIAEAKTKKEMLKARARAAEANASVQETLGSINPNGAMAAFERMEEKVLQQEARAHAAAELAGSDLESQFLALEDGGVEDELEALKNKLGGSSSAGALPPSEAIPLNVPFMVDTPEAEQAPRSSDE